MSGMRGSLEQFQTWNPREQASHAIVDGDMGGKPSVPMQQHSSLHRNDQQRSELFDAVRQDFADVGEVEARSIAGSHNVGHVHVARRAPCDNGAAPVIFSAFIEAGDGAGGHIARGLWLMIIGGAATIGGTAGGAHVIAGAFQQHDRKPDHLGMPQHVAPEPEGNATGYSHESSSSSLSCNRAKALTRGKYVGSCLGGSWRVTLSAFCLAILTSNIASNPANLSGHAVTQTPLLAQALAQATVSAVAVSPLASRRNPSVVEIGSAPRSPS